MYYLHQNKLRKRGGELHYIVSSHLDTDTDYINVFGAH